MSDKGSSQSASERLRLEGNELYKKNAFSQAYKKYSQAIEHDDKNAILYCNRAACALGLKRYIDASSDARKATELDPGYAKAWGRLAKAQTMLNSHTPAIESWKHAIAALPIENLTPIEEKLRAQYKKELAAAQATLTENTDNPKVLRANIAANEADQLPWNVASKLIPELTRTNTVGSSAWIINYAYTSWKEAIADLKQGKEVDVPLQGKSYFGSLRVIEGLSNALTADSRVFHISEPNFIEMYNKQMLFEICYSKAWECSGAREVMVEAPKRLAAEGWESVRPALALTVRAWIMRGFFEDLLGKSVDVAFEFFTSALELLQWGSQRWKDVPYEVKGSVFMPTFIRAVKSIRLDAYMKGYLSDRGTNSKYPLKALLDGANELIAETDILSGQQNSQGDAGFYLAFYCYPVAKAHALRGFYYQHTALLLREAAGMTTEVRLLYTLGARAYRTTIQYIPEDDEYYVWFLHCAFHLQFEAGAPFKDLLEYLDEIHDKMPGMKKIWGIYLKKNVDQRNRELQADMKLRDELHEAVRSGRIRQHELGNLMFKPGSEP